MRTSTAAPLPSPLLISACLDGIVHALSARPDHSEEQRTASARATMTLILSFLPRDVIQMMLAGQAVLFNALAADGGRDIMRGMADTLKLRAQSSVTNMGKITAKHLDTLIRLQGQVVREAASGEAEEKIPSAPAGRAGPETSGPMAPPESVTEPEPIEPFARAKPNAAREPATAAATCLTEEARNIVPTTPAFRSGRELYSPGGIVRPAHRLCGDLGTELTASAAPREDTVPPDKSRYGC